VGSPRSDAGEQGVEDRVRSSPTPSPFLRTSATGEGDKHVSGPRLSLSSSESHPSRSSSPGRAPSNGRRAL
jgi:hypothetical protein